MIFIALGCHVGIVVVLPRQHSLAISGGTHSYNFSVSNLKISDGDNPTVFTEVTVGDRVVLKLNIYNKRLAKTFGSPLHIF